MRIATVLLAALLVQAPPARAQAGSIPVTIFVSSGGESAGPIAGLQLSITRIDGGAPVDVTTDSLGQASQRLAPGRYRIRSLKSFLRGGEVYSWDIEATVRPRDQSVIVSLHRQNADLGIDFASLPASAVAPLPVPPAPRASKGAVRDDSAFVAFRSGGIFYRNVNGCEPARVPKVAERIYFRSPDEAMHRGLVPSKEPGCR